LSGSVEAARKSESREILPHRAINSTHRFRWDMAGEWA
jgi:hypothetical protein